MVFKCSVRENIALLVTWVPWCLVAGCCFAICCFVGVLLVALLVLVLPVLPSFLPVLCFFFNGRAEERGGGVQVSFFLICYATLASPMQFNSISHFPSQQSVEFEFKIEFVAYRNCKV